jgi:sugar phosphate isomerase/epimerase
MSEITTYRWSFDEDVTHYRAAGIPAIGVWRQKLSDFGEEKGLELLAESGLAVSNLMWAGGFTGSEGRTFRESVEDAVEAVELAGKLHAGCLVIYSGGRAGHTHNHAKRLLTEALKELAPLAEQHRVNLALEPMHVGCAAECTFLTNIKDALEVIGKVSHPRVQLAFDTYHIAEEPGLIDWIPELTPRIGIVHLGDRKDPPNHEHNRCRLGEGNLPLGEIIKALAGAGFDGDYDVELMGEEIEMSDYQDLLRHSQQAFRQWVA